MTHLLSLTKWLVPLVLDSVETVTAETALTTAAAAVTVDAMTILLLDAATPQTGAAPVEIAATALTAIAMTAPTAATTVATTARTPASSLAAPLVRPSSARSPWSSDGWSTSAAKRP